MRNPYKRTDVFQCRFEGHQKFSNRVSAYHVLKEKECYPQGCIIFKWDCRLKNKGKRCIRKLKYVGRLCEGCTYYHDEKIQYQPELLVSEMEYEHFLQELEDFDDWFEEKRQREVVFGGTVDSVKPGFEKKVFGKKGQLRLNGYLLIVKNGFIGYETFEDRFYVMISPHQQDRLKLSAGDQFEARGYLYMHRGRLVVEKVRAMEFEYRSKAQTWTNSEALVTRLNATQFPNQPEHCIHCPHGALVDVVMNQNNHINKKRELYCLKGMETPENCYISALDRINMCS